MGGWSAAGEDHRVLVWDPATPEVGPVELGHHDGPVRAVAVLPDGRVPGGGGRVLVWDPATPGAGPVEPVSDWDAVWAVAVLPDGRVVSGGEDHRVLAWDPATPGTDPVEPVSDWEPVRAVAVLPDGRVVSGGGGGRAVVWDVTKRSEIARISCPVYALATGPLRSDESTLVIAEEEFGVLVLADEPSLALGAAAVRRRCGPQDSGRRP
jgi:WD40 repeat protein